MIELAQPNDDAAIRSLLARNPVPGRVTVTFEREPSFLAGCATMGSACQTVVARMNNGEVVAVACRATREVFINGRIERLGYLGQLRVDAAQRGRWLVSRGFRFLQQLHDVDPVAGYLVSIIEGNAEAAGVLVKQRRNHFPAFHELGRLHTLALAVGKPKPALSNDIEIAATTPNDLPALIRFLQQHGARRQFYPVWRAEDFDSPTTQGLRLADVLIARRRGEIVGVSGWWNQSSFKQTVVRGYDRWLRTARPFYNAAAPWLQRPPLPDVGAEIRYGYAAFTCVAEDDVEVFRALLRALYNLTAQRGCHYLMIGLAERDPLLPLARAYAHIAYPSRLYLADWGESIYERLDQRIPYLEIATL